MITKFQKFLNDVKNKTISVLGMGVSNTPLIYLLLNAGAKVTIRDKAERDKLASAADDFEKLGAKFILGENYLEGITDEVIFRSPGIHPALPQIETAVKNGAYLTSEMEIFFEVCPGKIIAVTGSDGKTTTTTIIYELLKAQGFDCYVGGNIGTPLLDKTPDMDENSICVLELSSFQLITMQKSPDIAVITNITPNHLDVHKSYEEYIEAKLNVIKHNKNCRIILNRDNDETFEVSKEYPAHLFSRRFDTEYCLKDGKIYANEEAVIAISDIKIPGLHNVENYMAALAATDGIVDRDTFRQVAKTFNGVAHRMELVRELNGVRYYNDSIASSPTRTIAGFHTFDQKMILIAGGSDKKVPFDELGPEIIDHVKALVLIGKTSDKIEAAVLNADGAKPPIYKMETFEAAVKKAHDIAESGDIVALSPASPSFDLFKNFVARGNYFKELVSKL